MTNNISELIRTIDYNLFSNGFKNYQIKDLKDNSRQISVNKNEITSIIVNYGDISYKPYPMQVQRMEIHLYVLDRNKIVDDEKSVTVKQNSLRIGENDINLIDNIIREVFENENQKFLRSSIDYDTSTQRFTTIYSFDTYIC